MAVLEIELCRARQKDIARYERLLKTHLTDLERNFIELRLLQEQAALRGLGLNAQYAVSAATNPAG